MNDKCKSCKHRYLDVEEGHNCRRYHGKIVLSNGDVIPWPGQAVESAYKQCCGDGYERDLMGRFVYMAESIFT